MVLNKFGNYLLAKRTHAIWVALLFALLPLVQVNTTWIAVTIMALVTLHKGAKEGFWVLAWIMLPAIAALWLGDVSAFVVLGVGREALVWFLACVLGATASWRISLQLLASLGVLGVLLAHALVADLPGWWLPHLTNFWTLVGPQLQLNLSPEQTAQLLQQAAQFATGLTTAMMLLVDVSLLIIARSWQALLFNAGGFGKEWRSLRMPFWYSTILLVVVLLVWFGMGDVFKDVLPVLCAPLFLTGLSFIHAKLPMKKSRRLPWLILLYALLLFFFPYIAVLLVMLGFIDSCYDFRSSRASAV